MPMPRFVSWMLSVGILFGAGMAYGQNYPNRPIRIIVTAPAGGSLDFVARLVGRGLSTSLGQAVIVDNRGGANGIIGAELAAKSPPDGHTLLIVGNNFWVVQFMQDHVPYEPARDFAPITLAVRTPNILVVHPSLPVKSVKELIALAKARPGQLNYASGSNGSTIHLAAELFKAMAGVNIVHVPYKGSGPALNDLIAGQVQMMFGLSVMAHVRSGRLRALAVTTAEPSRLAPGLPTVAASGLPGFESAVIYSVLAPAGTPAAIIQRLNQDIIRFLNGAEVKALLLNDGSEPVGSTPAQLSVTVKSEIARWGKVIKDNRIRAE